MSMCFFIGHRDTSAEIYPALLEEVQRHITEYGASEFLVGNYGAFDHMAARAVIEAKLLHPDIKLTMLLPYHPAERTVSVPDGFDGTLYPPDMERVPRRLAIVRANYYALDKADYLIACVSRPGNARNLLEHAQSRKNLQISLLKI